MPLPWEKNTAAKFQQLLARIPLVLRPIAQDKISKKAVFLATTSGHNEIDEKDMIDAFFSETPFGFHGPMKSDMDALGIDYKQYGYS